MGRLARGLKVLVAGQGPGEGGQDAADEDESATADARHEAAQATSLHIRVIGARSRSLERVGLLAAAPQLIFRHASRTYSTLGADLCDAGLREGDLHARGPRGRGLDHRARGAAERAARLRLGDAAQARRPRARRARALPRGAPDRAWPRTPW